MVGLDKNDRKVVYFSPSSSIIALAMKLPKKPPKVARPDAGSSDAGFAYTRSFFENLVDSALLHAKKLGATDASVVGGCSVRGGSPLISVIINGMVSGCVVNTIRGCSSVGVGAAKVLPDDEGRGGSGDGVPVLG